MTRRVTILGLGLIGGAIGIALRQAGWRVLYLDPDVAEHDARAAGAADSRVQSAGGEDVVLVATPVDVAVELVRALAPTSAAVTSVCSVMQPLRAVAGANFVAGHPMTGWHEGGLANAHHVTLAGTSWFLDAADERVEELVHDCAATPMRIDAAEHDAGVALSSHLPQVLSTALFAYLSERPGVAAVAGSGLRSFRLAASDGAMWHSVLQANRENLRPHAAAIARLVEDMIEGKDRDAFAKARAFWRRLDG